MKIQKIYLYTITVGDFYQYKAYKIVDGAGQVFYTAHPIAHGGTVLADKEEDLKPQLEKQVPILNDFLSKVL